jgi:hypothetical protein
MISLMAMRRDARVKLVIACALRVTRTNHIFEVKPFIRRIVARLLKKLFLNSL